MRTTAIRILIAAHLFGIVFGVFVAIKRDSFLPYVACLMLGIMAAFLWNQVLPATKEHDRLDASFGKSINRFRGMP